MFVVTNTALDKINGNELMTEVKDVLGCKAVLLFLRNDPWFYGYSHDIGTYKFTNSHERMTPEECLKTKAML